MLEAKKKKMIVGGEKVKKNNTKVGGRKVRKKQIANTCETLKAMTDIL
jgi:hypothetical protein